MTTLVVENTTISDAAGRAARVAPSKGAAWDKAQGVMLAVRPGTNGPLRITATDLESTYFQRIMPISAEGDPIDWRIPSGLLAGFLAELPMSAGKTVTLTDKDGMIHLSSGRARAKFRVIVNPLPLIKLFAPEGMEKVSDFTQRIGQVAWAVHNDPGVLAGVHIDGTYLWACDRYRLARIPCTVPITVPITVPFTKLVGLVKNSGEVLLRATDDRLEIMPDKDTQMTCNLYQQPYPNVGQIVESLVMTRAYGVQRQELSDVLTRMLTLVKGERHPRAVVTFPPATEGKALMQLRLALEDVGDISDEVEVSATVTGPDAEVQVWINPNNLLSAAQHASREMLTIKSDGNPYHALLVTDDSQFMTWVMPMKES